MEDPYYSQVRVDIRHLLPARATRIVDVGCGAGVTLRWLKTFYPAAYTIGLEGNAVLKDDLERNASEVHIADLNGDMPELGSPDLILFLDVLEHLPQPEAVLRRYVSQLAAGGSVIVSVPNVAHLSVSLPLLFRGTFTYADAGILDRTHLRFFDTKSAVTLLNDAGLVVDGKLVGLYGRAAHLIDRVTAGAARSRLAKNLILRGSRESAEPAGGWGVA